LRVFLRDNLIRAQAAGRERVVIFDEAQRAWDADRVLLKHRGQLIGSEPELLVRVGSRGTPPFVLVALVGEGQEIHAGEEAGIGQWVHAIRKTTGWNVIAPPHVADPFRREGVSAVDEPLLNLTATLRSHRASKVAAWTDMLLEGDLEAAAAIATDLRLSGFALLIARELEPLRQYLKDRYACESEKRYGVLVSSKFRHVDDHGVQPVRADYWYYGEWYEERASHPRSGCQLQLAVTEFGCQGLELDLPLVCWGPDLTWSGNGWTAHTGRSRSVKDPARLRRNAYRVLLTRGRDGLCVFVPRDPSAAMDATYDALRAAGLREI
jgi:hypothetical protein